MQREVCNKDIFDYLEYLPKDYNLFKKYPLVLFLHGAGERSSNLELLKEAIVPKIMQEKDDFQAVVISPLCKEGIVWTSQTESLFKFIDSIVGKYSIDINAISVTGLSMGGYGTWQLIMDKPDLFSAAAPICGGGLAPLLYPAVNLPIRIFHGEKDDIVDCFYSKDAYNRLVSYGAKNIELTLYPECYHDCWTKAYRETNLLQWLIEQRK